MLFIVDNTKFTLYNIYVNLVEITKQGGSEMNFLVIICVVGLVGGSAIARYFEKKHFNRGICPLCNGKLHNFDTDSQGGRGYICEHCSYTTWVSYNVDNNYIDKTL